MMDAPAAANWIGDDFEPDYDGDAVRASQPAETARIGATPFTAWGSEIDLPTRKWLYGTHLIRGRVSLDVAAGGVGKTAVKVGEALAMAAGRDLFNKALPEGPLRVWLYNLEDDHDELTLRLRAAAKYHQISQSDTGDRLYVDSGLDQPCIVATQQASGTIIAQPVVEALIAEIRARKIDVLIVDPFVSSHGAPENDNNAIDLVVKRAFVRIAYECQCAVNLVHHIRKGNGEEANADSARGASALIGAARSVQVFNRMSEDEAARADVEADKRKFYFRVTNEKANMAPPPERADWYRMQSVELDNGEKIGVASQFLWPAAKVATFDQIDAAKTAVSDGSWRQSPQCDQWVGYVLAPIFGVNPSDKASKKKLSGVIGDLIKAGHLAVEERKDEKRMTKAYVVAGASGV